MSIVNYGVIIFHLRYAKQETWELFYINFLWVNFRDFSNDAWN